MERPDARRIASLLAYATDGVDLERAFAAQRGGLFRMPVIYGPCVAGDRLTILDIGAGDGRSGRDALRIFPNALIHSFEPRDDAWRSLELAASAHENWHPHRLALGARRERRAMTVFPKAGESSSFYTITKTWVEGWPAEDFTSSRQVEMQIEPLDDWADAHGVKRVDIMKLDVQGAELDVLEGGRSTLGRTQSVIIEHMFVEGYESAPGFAAVYAALIEHGFSLVTMENFVRDPDGRLLQSDAYYRRF